MIELLIFACIVIVALVAVMGYEAMTHERGVTNLIVQQEAERAAWRDERRFLIDRAIARHIGEVVALEREDSRKNENQSIHEERQPRPLLEGLS
jgi:hypothetical protein